MNKEGLLFVFFVSLASIWVVCKVVQENLEAYRLNTNKNIKTLAEHREPITEPVTNFETNPPKAYLWKD